MDQRDDGYALIDALVAIFILSITAGFVTILHILTVKSVDRLERQSNALSLAINAMDQITGTSERSVELNGRALREQVRTEMERSSGGNIELSTKEVIISWEASDGEIENLTLTARIVE